MTSDQHYFPYLFNPENFNADLKRFDLTSYVRNDDKEQIPEALLIKKKNQASVLLSVPFGATLMIQDDKLFYWETDTNLVNISQVSLDNLTADPWILNTKVDLTLLHLGKNSIASHLDIAYLVTYARKDSLQYNEDYCEKFAIIIVEKEHINILPFDWFNTASTEYDYVWPATAKLEIDSGKLYGQGMRMADFCIELDKACL